MEGDRWLTKLPKEAVEKILEVYGSGCWEKTSRNLNVQKTSRYFKVKKTSRMLKVKKTSKKLKVKKTSRKFKVKKTSRKLKVKKTFRQVLRIIECAEGLTSIIGSKS